MPVRARITAILCKLMRRLCERFILWKECMVLLRFSVRVTAFLVVALSISGCQAKQGEDIPLSLNTSDEYSGYKGSTLGRQVNDALLAEMYFQTGQFESSVKHYLMLLSDTTDVAITKRATEVAAQTNHLDAGLESVRRWLALKPESLGGRQYLALLLLRNEQFSLSADQLLLIKDLVEKNKTETKPDAFYSKGLKFVGALLNVESHHQQALQAFDSYIQKYDSKPHQAQQDIITASLAMKAKKYQRVITALNDIDEMDKPISSEMVKMKAKAFQKLNRVTEAVDTLKSYVDKQAASDSDHLELIRLLIINKQKNVAGKYLVKLVEKHPNNNDLLKSLIALEIDQSQLKKAKENIQKLRKTVEFLNDADYFSGEVMEAEGDLENALKRYKKVKKGKLLKRAQKKVVAISRVLSKDNMRKKVNYRKSN